MQGQLGQRLSLDLFLLMPWLNSAGKQFWKELDRDGDGRVSSDDVKAILRKRKLPESYSSDFIKAARGSRWWSNSIE